MKKKPFLKVLLLSFWCLASLKWTSAASTTEPTSSGETTEAETPLYQNWEYPKSCYVEKSKVAELMIKMNTTVQILNPQDQFLKCQDKMEVVVVDTNIDMCTEDRITRIQKNLIDIAGRLFKLATRLTEPSEEEVLDLDIKKFQLIDNLKAINVFYGPSPCESSSIVLYPFHPMVEYVEWNLNQVLVMFQTTRPTRPPPPPTTPSSATTSTTPEPSIDDMLNPTKSFQELVGMAASNPSAMSRALPKIVSQRYNRRTSTLDALLNFVEAMPTTENQIFGLSAVYDEMHRYNRNPETLKLVKLAIVLEPINASAPTTLEPDARSTMNDLVNDPDLYPVVFMLNHQTSLEELAAMARTNPPAMFLALSKIVSERYTGNVSTLDGLLNFVDGLPTTEEKIIGAAAVYDEMRRQNRSLDLLHLRKVAKFVGRCNETAGSGNSADATARSKLASLVNDFALNPMIRMLNQRASFRELTDLARGNPEMMSEALAEIVPQRFNHCTVDTLLSFIEGLPKPENKIFGVSAVYGELSRLRDSVPVALMKLANAVERINMSTTANRSSIQATAKSKLADLASDHDLSPVNLLLSPQRSFEELAEMAQTNPPAMSLAIPEIVSQRYTANVSTLDSLLNFMDGLPTTEDKIFGAAAVYDAMRRQNRSLDLLHLREVAKFVVRLNDTAVISGNSTDASARSKLADLVKDSVLNPMIRMLNERASFRELTDLARSNPEIMSEALVEIVPQRYTGSLSALEALLNFIDGLPTTENKMIGLPIVHAEMGRHNQSLDASKLFKLTEKVKRLNETVPAISNSTTAATRMKWTSLVHDLSPLILIGEKADCYVTNVAYNTQLIAQGESHPVSAYVYIAPAPGSKKLTHIYPRVVDGKVIFRIDQYSHEPLYISNTNPSTESYNNYRTKPSERYVLMQPRTMIPSNVEVDWKIVLAPGQANQFKILSAKSEDFLFVHKSSTGLNNWRRVLLGKKSYTDHDHIPNADLWTLDCKPSTFSIPSN